MYVDAVWDRENDRIKVVERVDGQRVYKEYPAEYVFYYENERGNYKTMWGNPCIKVSTTSHKKFMSELSQCSDKIIHESDINPIFRCLENNYSIDDTPNLNVAFFDIEVNFLPDKGFASPWDPFADITAISVYLSHLEKLITLVIKPSLPQTDPYFLSYTAAEEITNRFDDCILCDSEEQLLTSFIELVQDSDVLSGWNSTGYDMPYVVNRIERIMDKDHSKKLCLWGRRPKKREFTKFKKKQATYDLVGRIHLDYLDLYQKHNTQQLHSYRLDFVGEIEVKENKIPYEGTLDMLYKRDFEKFIAYNRQDTLLLYKIDKKCKYIELANQLAHTNSVLLPTSMGSVQLIEQAITNECHSRGMVVPNKKLRIHIENENGEDEELGPAVGAYVADPKIGLSEHVACCDISSLYPSTLRALNMGPETLVGQIRPQQTDKLIAERIKAGCKAPAAWHELFCLLEFESIHKQTDELLTIDFKDKSVETTAKELYDYIFNQGNPYCLSANGTIFRTDIEAVIPGLLKKWYQQRQELQKKAKAFKKSSIEETDPEEKIRLLKEFDFYDQRQLAKKILLNSLYGALLNQHCKFYDYNIGQSTTLTGRSIAKHMNSKINEIITGKYSENGEAIVYADTDSSYFTVMPLLAREPELGQVLNTREAMIQFYDDIAEQVNETFPDFMNEKFNTGLQRGAIINAGRELVGSRGLFITKKRYAILMYDKEGTRLDVDGKPGKIKAMGLDLKRSDTPKMMQIFLEEVLMELLKGGNQKDIIELIKQFRNKFKELPGWSKGTPKRVNSVLDYYNRTTGTNTALNFRNLKGKSDKKASTMIPGHVQAALNWNKLRRLHSDNYSMEIQDGQKVIVCKLKPNALQMDSVAYPIDESHLPNWFKELPFDNDAMQNTIIDMKINNLLGCLNWDLRNTKDDTTFNDLFSFGGNND